MMREQGDTWEGLGQKKVKEGNDVITLISKIKILILLKDQKEAFVPHKKK